MQLKKNGVIRVTEDTTKIKYLKSIGYVEIKEAAKKAETPKKPDVENK